MKKVWIALTLVVLIIVAGFVVMFVNSNQKPSVPGVVLDQQTKDDVMGKLANWPLYQRVDNASYQGSFGNNADCDSGNSEFIDYVKKAENGSIYRLDLPYTLSIVYTPNYENWTKEKFLSFNSRDMGICGIGGPGPLSVSGDKVLWLENRCGGAGCPPGYAGMEDQNYALEGFISDYFNKK